MSTISATFNEGTCEHDMSADLCYGPGHYPPDSLFLDYPDDDVRERFAGERIPDDWDEPSLAEILFRRDRAESWDGWMVETPDFCDGSPYHYIRCPNILAEGGQPPF